MSYFEMNAFLMHINDKYQNDMEKFRSQIFYTLAPNLRDTSLTPEQFMPFKWDKPKIVEARPENINEIVKQLTNLGMS